LYLYTCQYFLSNHVINWWVQVSMDHACVLVIYLQTIYYIHKHNKWRPVILWRHTMPYNNWYETNGNLYFGFAMFCLAIKNNKFIFRWSKFSLYNVNSDSKIELYAAVSYLHILRQWRHDMIGSTFSDSLYSMVTIALTF
jgi:hypothetical protein